jgi:tRNA(Ile)-lysidine synthase
LPRNIRPIAARSLASRRTEQPDHAEALIDTPVNSADVDPDLTARFAERLAFLWPENERTGPLGLAVSGGPDSLALMLLANAALSGEVVVASVDHGLRLEASDEVAFVGRVCAALDIPFTPISVRVGTGNLQAKAREARYSALSHWVEACGLGALATAHHADDQAETLLMRLVRGSGLSGLAGVRAASLLPDGETPLLRPLLDWRKGELEDLVAAAGIEPVRDPSNKDQSFDRVRMRDALAEHGEWLPVDALATSAQHLAESWRAIEWYAQLDWEEMVVREEGLAYRYFANVPRVVAIETIVRIIEALGGIASRSEAGRAYDRLWRGENASLSGVLIVPGVEMVEKVGVAMRAWRFTPEPQRKTN